MSNLNIRVLSERDNLKDFLDVVDSIYASDPNYVRPLDWDVRQRLSLSHPYFQHASRALFVAYRGSTCVGRVVAHKNDLHLERHRDGVGFFGFFDTVDDAEVVKGLMDAVAFWHSSRGVTRLRGPITLNMAEEVGCLIEGFDTPPFMLTHHHRPYQAGLLEAAGFEKAKDTYAWRYHCKELPPRVQRAHAEIKAMPEVRCRNVDMKSLDRDVSQMLSIYNDAWQDSWGYVPLTPKEAERAASEFKLFADLKLTRIVDIDGVPSAFAYALPNVNEVIADLGGKLGGLGLPKLLFRLKVRGTKTARLVGLGIAKRLRGVRKYAGLSAFMYAELNQAGLEHDYKWGELSYTLEDNGPVNVAVRALDAKIYKRYRVFEKAI